MLLVSFVLGIVHIFTLIAGVVFMAVSRNTQNYEHRKTGFILYCVATVAIFTKFLLNIAMQTDSFELSLLLVTYAITFITTLIGYSSLAAMPKPVPELSEEDLFKIEQQKIMDELNGIYLHPEKVVDDNTR